MKRSGTRGSMVMEAVVCIPVLLVMILGCMQIAHIWFARQVVQYAAYAAARVLLSTPNQDHEKAVAVNGAAWKAAAQVCSWIALSQPEGSEEWQIPGWGGVPGSGGMEKKVKVELGSAGDEWSPMVTVVFDFPLVMPVAGHIIARGMNPWAEQKEWQIRHADMTGDAHSGEAMNHPYIRFTESAALVKPYILQPFTGGPR